MTKCIFVLASGISFLTLTACASSPEPISLALDQLGGEVRTTGYRENLGDRVNFTKYSALPQRYNRTSVNITGLGLPTGVGQLVTAPRSNVAENMATQYVTDCSRIIEIEYPTPTRDKPIDVVMSETAQALQQVNFFTAKQAAFETRAVLAEYALKRTTELGEANAVKDKAIIGVAQSLGLDMPAPVDGQTLIADAFRNDAGVSRMQVEKASSEATDATMKIQNIGNLPNMILTRWSAESDTNQTSVIGNIFSRNAIKNTKRTGFVILADLKISSLVPGDDLAYKVADKVAKVRTGSDTLFGDPYIVSYSLAAKHVAYVEDINLTEQINLALNLNADDIVKLAGGDVGKLLKAQDAKWASKVARTAYLGGRGYITGGTRKVYRFTFYDDRHRDYAVQAQSARMSGYNIVMTNRLDLEKTLSQAKKPRGDWVGTTCGSTPTDFNTLL